MALGTRCCPRRVQMMEYLTKILTEIVGDSAVPVVNCRFLLPFHSHRWQNLKLMFLHSNLVVTRKRFNLQFFFFLPILNGGKSFWCPCPVYRVVGVDWDTETRTVDRNVFMYAYEFTGRPVATERPRALGRCLPAKPLGEKHLNWTPCRRDKKKKHTYSYTPQWWHVANNHLHAWVQCQNLYKT